MSLGAGKMAHFKALTALPRDQGLIPSTHLAALTTSGSDKLTQSYMEAEHKCT